jgi:hypothetical protein
VLPLFQASVVKPVETIGCSAPGCTTAPTVQWQRHGTQDEYDAAMGTKLAPNDGVLKVSVFACDEHALSPDQMAFTHGTDCTLASRCVCSPEHEALAYTTPSTAG